MRMCLWFDKLERLLKQLRALLKPLYIVQGWTALSFQRFIVAWVHAEDGDPATTEFVVDLVGAAEAFRGRYEAPWNPLRFWFPRTIHENGANYTSRRV